MKRLTALALFLMMGSGALAAETELACWNMYSKGKSRPILTAKIENNLIQSIFINKQDPYFELYDRVKKEWSDHWKSEGVLTSRIFSRIEKSEIEAAEITSKRTIYIGNMGYDFVIGDHSFKSAWYNNAGKYHVRLMLPKDLSSDFLKNFRIRLADERSNAVMVLPPPSFGGQDGDNYLRMYCTSK